MDHNIVADQTYFGAAADQALGDPAAGDLADFRNREDFQDFGVAKETLSRLWHEHAGERRPHIIDDVVNDVVITDFNAFPARAISRLRIGANIEPDDGSARGVRENDIRFSNTADPAVQDVRSDFIGSKVGERAINCFQRTLNIGFDHNRQ